MGNPNNFSVELPKRCFKLLNEMWEKAETVFPEGDRDNGALTHTFLLAMAYPIIVTPIERVERLRSRNFAYFINDRGKDDVATMAIERNMAKKAGSRAFFEKGLWRYSKLTETLDVNFADNMPANLAVHLASREVIDAAAALPAAKFVSILRNALSHGGIAYLNGDFQLALNQPATHLCFLSGNLREDEDRQQQLDSVNLLAISAAGFRSFLGKWVESLDPRPHRNNC
jgi:hypothetical protein